MAKLTARSSVTQPWAQDLGFPIDSSEIKLHEAPFHGIVRLQGRGCDSEFRRAVKQAIGMDLPEPGRMFSQNETCIAWSGPNEWLVFCPVADEYALLDALETAVGKLFANATLMSDSRLCLLLSGATASDLLAKGCGIDTDPSCFSEGKVVTTRFASLPAMIIHQSRGHYRLYFDVSYASYIVGWLVDAATEFTMAEA